jgi:hypothetical protein
VELDQVPHTQGVLFLLRVWKGKIDKLAVLVLVLVAWPKLKAKNNFYFRDLWGHFHFVFYIL